MNSYREPLFAGIVVILAFIGGYKQNSLQALWHSQFNDQEEVSSEQPAPAALGEPVPLQRPAGMQPSRRPAPSQPANPYADMMKRSMGSSPPQAAPPANPYRETFKSTMESIRPGVIGKQQSQKRNLYFDRLRDQLKELQARSPTPKSDPRAVEAGRREAMEKERLDQARKETAERRTLDIPDGLEADMDDGGGDFEDEPEMLDEDLEDTIAEILAEETL